MNGLDRLAVLWQSVSWQLPDNQGLLHLYRIETDSPASSVLGETGLDGDIDHHYLKKIGGILGMSLIQGGIQYGVAKAQSSGQGNTSVNLDSFQQGGNEAASTLLQSWVYQSLTSCIAIRGWPARSSLSATLDFRGHLPVESAPMSVTLDHLLEPISQWLG